VAYLCRSTARVEQRRDRTKDVRLCGLIVHAELRLDVGGVLFIIFARAVSLLGSQGGVMRRKERYVRASFVRPDAGQDAPHSLLSVEKLISCCQMGCCTLGDAPDGVRAHTA
jgi:hypothetical protein